MGLQGKFQVLHTFRPYLRFIAAFNIENFQNNALRIVRYNALKAFLNIILFISAFVTCWLNYWSCIRDGFDLAENSGQIVPILAGTQQIFIYVSIIKKNREITKAVERLQEIVENRNVLGSNFGSKWQII